jgi:O-antigen/teichoic acid export membrane protein
VLGSVASFRYEFSIINADDEEQAMSQLGISVLFSLISSVVVTFCGKIWGGVFAKWINLPEFEKFLYLVPLVVLFSGAGNGLYFWTSRAGNFGKIAIARIVSSGVLVGSILILGWLTEAGGVVLIASTVAGSFHVSRYY